MQGHDICPFCKEVYPAGERTECPTCEVQLIPAVKHESSVQASTKEDEEAEDEEDEEDEEERISWLHWRNGRGVMVAVSGLGIALFFLPWVHVFTPDRAVYTGLDMARRTGLAWAAVVGWFTLIPTILSRKTLSKLKSARLAAVLLAVIPALVTTLFLLNPPGSLRAQGISLRIRYEWGVGLYLTLALGLLSALYAALRLGKE